MRFCGGNAFYFDELRQECVLALWTEFSRHGLDRFRGDSEESTWVYQIAYHAVVHYLRNPKNMEFLSVKSLCDAPVPGNGDDWRLLDELMEQLNNRERIMLGHFLDDDSYCTIARQEGISEAGACKRMSRLLSKLRMLVHP